MPIVPHRSQDRNVIDLNYLQRIANGNDLFLTEMMRLFESETNRGVELMKDQFYRKDYPALYKTVHMLKPAGAYVGANEYILLMDKLAQQISLRNECEIAFLLKAVQVLLNEVNNEIDNYLTAHES